MQVELYWVNPAFFGISALQMNLIGFTRIDLALRSSFSCHKLVKCPKLWTPLISDERPIGSNADECLIVRISSIGDPIGTTNPWQPPANRHVAQYNITVVPAGTAIPHLLNSLAKNN